MKLQTPSLLTIKQNYSKDKKSNSTVFEFLKLFFSENERELKSSYPGIKLNFFVEEFLHFSKVPLNSSIWDDSFSQSWTVFNTFLEDGLPFEYINNRAFFFESFFYVDRRVLIPRFETEVLLEHSIEELKLLTKTKSSELSICEVGIGPGTIGFSILKYFVKNPLKLVGVDISRDALEVAEINRFRLLPSFNPQHSVELIEGDRLSAISDQFDLIVSNPPYIKEIEDRELVHEKVLEHEPSIALFLNDESYEEWFMTFFRQARERLRDGGMFLMEGHESHLVQLGTLCKNVFNSPVEILNDLSGAARLLKVRKENG